MSASNTKGCIRDLIGKRIVGVMFDALPVGNRSLQQGTKTLVFEDGSGFTFSARGTFWSESVHDINRAIQIQKNELRANQRDIEEVLALAGSAAE